MTNNKINQLNEELAATNLEISKLGVKWAEATDPQKEKILLERSQLDAKHATIIEAIGVVREAERQRKEAAEKAARNHGRSSESRQSSTTSPNRRLTALSVVEKENFTASMVDTVPNGWKILTSSGQSNSCVALVRSDGKKYGAVRR